MAEKDPGQRYPSIEPAKVVDDIAVCPHEGCECDMVYPIDWEQAEGPYWDVTLRCPNCEDVRPAKMDEELIERFDCLLDSGIDVLVRDLRNISYQNMAGWVNQFVDAVNNDHILPEDFNFTPRPDGDLNSGNFYQERY